MQTLRHATKDSKIVIGAARSRNMRHLEALAWLRRIRWVALAGHLFVFFVAGRLLSESLPSLPLFMSCLALAFSNAALYANAAKISLAKPERLGWILLFDVFNLTYLLYSYGGHTNPFSIFYLLHVVIAALVAGTYWTGTISLVSSACFLSLFWWHVPLAELDAHHHGHGEGFNLHLQGMLVSYIALAAVLTGFVTRMRQAFDRQQRLLAEAYAQEGRLSSLTALSAGAAHELATPLSTIQIAASELEAVLKDNPDWPVVEPDVSLIRSQLDRCGGILQSLHLRAGVIDGEMPSPGTVREIVDAAIGALNESDRDRIEVRAEPAVLDWETLLPDTHVIQALSNLLGNAAVASGESPVRLLLTRRGEEIAFTIEDKGTGMSEESLARLGEPFNTTKENGMGLGVFLAGLVCRALGGTLSFTSKQGQGTTAVLLLPARIDWRCPRNPSHI